VKIFALYTLARAALFGAAFGLIWLIAGSSLEWNAVSGLYTALIALVISSAIALVALRGLRARAAEQLAAGVSRARTSYEARRSAEDDD
jgi:hypothetical protein